MLRNIISNAIKFTPDEGRVTVKLERDGNNAKLSITDTGIGIEPEFLPMVFERYRQAHNSTTNRKGGLGLGLAIVKNLVEMHEGKIAVSSLGEGHGSTFAVTLPLMPQIDFLGLD